MRFGPIFSLTDPRDLLKKAEHDLGRLRTNPLSAYAAFDFFVTVRHLPDWLHPGDKASQSALFSKHVELRIARHLADGAKHVVLHNTNLKQVSGTVGTQPAFQRGAFSDAFQTGRLVVQLDPRDPDTLSLGAEIEALELAERTFAVARGVVV